MSEPELVTPRLQLSLDPREAAGLEPTAGPERTDATVLMPIFNEERHIAQTIAALGSQDFAGTVEFLLIDGRSTDGTRSVIQRLTAQDSRFILLDNPHRATPHALNIGLRAARGRHIVRMDAHTHYPVDYISRGVARVQRGDVAWVSGPQMPHGVGDWSRRCALALGTWLGRGEAKFRVVPAEEIDVDTGFSGVWRRETLERHGGWDEAWPINQDSEMAARFRQAGDRIVCLPELEARYIPRDSLQAIARQYWRYGIYRAKTTKRHPHSMRRSHILAPGVAGAVIGSVAAPGRLRGAARLGLAGYVATIVGVSADVARRGHARDAPFLPAVFATMHLSWGFGFLGGCARFGIPARALLGMVGLSQPEPAAHRPGLPVNGDGPALNGTAHGPALNGNGHEPVLNGNGHDPVLNGNGHDPVLDGDGHSPAVNGDGRTPAVNGDGHLSR